MKNTRSINPIEIAFVQWISQYPNSFHPCDRRRFYCFVTTIIKYEKDGNKWLNKDYFKKRTKPYLEKENIESYYKNLQDFVDFFDLKPYPVNKVVRHHLDENSETTYVIEYALKDKLYVKCTDKDNFERIKSLKRAIVLK